MKGYLFEMILDSLQLSGILKSETAKCVQLWQQVQILKAKGLAEKALQVIKQAYKKAHECEIFWLETAFRKELFNTTRLSWKIEDREKNLHLFHNDIQLIRQKDVEADMYLSINQRYHTISIKQVYSTQTDIPPLDEAILFGIEKPALSISGERMKLAAIERYYSVTGDIENGYIQARKMYELEKKLYLQKSSLSIYEKRIKSILALIIACLNLRKFAEATALNNEMVEIRSSNELHNEENQLVFFTNNNFVYWASGKHKQGERYFKENLPTKILNKSGDRFKLFLPEIQRFYPLFLFSNGKSKELFRAIADLEIIANKKELPYYYKSAELLKILAHIDDNNYDILPTLVPTTLKHLTAYGLTKFEQQVFKKLKSIPEGNRPTILKQLQLQLENATEKIWLFNVLDLITWCRKYTEEKQLSLAIASQSIP